jgi:hypothetical protein
LRDDSKFSSDDLQQLTFHLCHMFVSSSLQYQAVNSLFWHSDLSFLTSNLNLRLDATPASQFHRRPTMLTTLAFPTVII